MYVEKSYNRRKIYVGIFDDLSSFIIPTHFDFKVLV